MNNATQHFILANYEAVSRSHQNSDSAMGLKQGEKMVRLGIIRVTEARNEPLQRMIDDPEYGKSEAAKEGFPELSGAEFVEMFCKHMKVVPSYAPKRIEYEYVDGVTE